MPLNTEILRDGKALPLHWGDFHVAAMILASYADEDGMDKVMHYSYVDTCIGEFADHELTAHDYPEVPCPINSGIAFQLTMYDVIGACPLGKGNYTLQKKHTFFDTQDGEILYLLPGDELRAWRSWK